MAAEDEEEVDQVLEVDQALEVEEVLEVQVPLDPQEALRAHRQALANLEAVEAVVVPEEVHEIRVQQGMMNRSSRHMSLHD